MCERQYDMTAVAALQQAAANVEAERRRLYRDELAQELRQRLASRRKTRAVLMYIEEFEQWLNELAPVVTCDNPAN